MDDEESVKDVADGTEQTAATETSSTEESQEEVTQNGNETAEEAAADSNGENDVPIEFQSALNRAQSFSDTMHMSKSGLYDQLTSEYGDQFSTEAAQYAVDNVEADWKENALRKAEDYAETMHMSKAGVYDQLTSEYGEQFIQEEADYAIDNLEK
ncbi:Ltp family lipoprotein [Atopococcus tabaci]|uniref:Ltp family lipoprotein n=1 Tax=Atopococcus tabaci TaxID=269774 RepID=UPI0024093ABC|nr:Ltp family lipoprotein [Atopococcus tabaci]